MTSIDNILRNINNIKSEDDFNLTALEVFYFQYSNNSVYNQWVNYLNTKVDSIKHYSQIPFLPISLFKTHKIKSFEGAPEIIFQSSGTTGMERSKHYVADIDIYRKSYLSCFEQYYNNVEDYVFLALLPSYLEREGSSLILMVEDFISKSKYSESDFYLYNYTELFNKLSELKVKKRKVILWGVSFALLEFAENHKIHFPELIIMETGGMKGKRKEILRKELHAILNTAFGTKNIHSEYGMTELLSQAYSQGNGIFSTPNQMKALIRDTNDPLSIQPNGKTGGINIIDLNNIYSCSFIASQDLGKLYDNGDFEVVGRFDNSDIRGCNLMVL